MAATQADMGLPPPKKKGSTYGKSVRKHQSQSTFASFAKEPGASSGVWSPLHREKGDGDVVRPAASSARIAQPAVSKENVRPSSHAQTGASSGAILGAKRDAPAGGVRTEAAGPTKRKPNEVPSAHRLPKKPRSSSPEPSILSKSSSNDIRSWAKPRPTTNGLLASRVAATPSKNMAKKQSSTGMTERLDNLGIAERNGRLASTDIPVRPSSEPSAKLSDALAKNKSAAVPGPEKAQVPARPQRRRLIDTLAAQAQESSDENAESEGEEESFSQVSKTPPRETWAATDTSSSTLASPEQSQPSLHGRPISVVTKKPGI